MDILTEEQLADINDFMANAVPDGAGLDEAVTYFVDELRVPLASAYKAVGFTFVFYADPAFQLTRADLEPYPVREWAGSKSFGKRIS